MFFMIICLLVTLNYMFKDYLVGYKKEWRHRDESWKCSCRGFSFSTSHYLFYMVVFQEFLVKWLIAEVLCLHILPFHLSFTVSWFWIAFADNAIEDIPASFCNLIHLKSLCLNNNNINQVLTVHLQFYWYS